MTNKPEKTTVTVRLKESTREWLDGLSKKDDRTLSYLIRRIVEKAEEEAKKQGN